MKCTPLSISTGISGFNSPSPLLCSSQAEHLRELYKTVTYIGCIRLGNPYFDFEFRISDFGFEREIQKWISPMRNTSSRWISIKKSKSRPHGFIFYRSIGKSEKAFGKLFSQTAVLLIHNGWLPWVFLPQLEMPLPELLSTAGPSLTLKWKMWRQVLECCEKRKIALTGLSNFFCNSIISKWSFMWKRTRWKSPTDQLKACYGMFNI